MGSGPNPFAVLRQHFPPELRGIDAQAQFVWVPAHLLRASVPVCDVPLPAVAQGHYNRMQLIHDSPKTSECFQSEVRNSSVNRTWGQEHCKMPQEKHHHFNAPLVLWKPSEELELPGTNTNDLVNVRKKGFWVYFPHFPNVTSRSMGSADSYEPFKCLLEEQTFFSWCGSGILK